MKDALIFLIDTFTQLYLLILLLRFWLPIMRVNFSNPVSQGVLRFTAPVVVPVRRFIPAIGKLDTATVLVALVIKIAALALIIFIARGSVALDVITTRFPYLLANAFLELASLSVIMFIVVIIVRVVLSLLGRYFGPVADLLTDMTEPLLRPIRRFVPPIGMIDLSAYVTLVLLIALNMVITDLKPALF